MYESQVGPVSYQGRTMSTRRTSGHSARGTHGERTETPTPSVHPHARNPTRFSRIYQTTIVALSATGLIYGTTALIAEMIK